MVLHTYLPVSSLAMRILSLLFAASAALVTAPTGLAEQLSEVSNRFMATHCVTCHDAESKEGGLDLTAATLDLADHSQNRRWIKLFDKVQGGEMPPASEPRPNADQLRSFLHELDDRLTQADEARRKQTGRTVIRRLNRNEYENSLSQLFDMPIDIREILPPDATHQGFDTVGAALNVSAVQMESYLEALDRVLDQATILHEPIERKLHRLSYHNCVGTMKEFRRNQPALVQPDGVAFFATEKLAHLHTVMDQYSIPLDGHYKVRVSAYAIRSPEPITLTLRVGGTGYHESLDLPHRLLRNAGVYEGEPQIIEWEGWLQRGHYFHAYPNLRPMRFIKELRQEEYQGPGVVVQWMEVDGPIVDQWPRASHRRLWEGVPTKPIPDVTPNADINAQLSDPPDTKVVIRYPIKGSRDKAGHPKFRYEDHPNEFTYHRVPKPDALRRTLELAPENPKADTRRLLTSFVAKAFRRPTSSADVEPFVRLANDWLDKGQSFEDAMRTAYKAVLTSPEFLYFSNRRESLDDYAVAERLAYFLWRQPPDETLRALASQGELAKPDVLRSQTERLLGDARARHFVNDLAGQWLDLKLIDFTSPDSDLYPEFDKVLEWSMVQETQLFVQEMLEKNLPARTIVDSDFAILNDRLAKLYGIPAVRGSEFRRVPLPDDSSRGGLLTQASILKVTANGTTTSPVVRGKWVLERILGIEADPPPPGVPAIEPDIRGAVTVMEQLEKHRNATACASCHAKFDPLGVALECFDVMGAERVKYRALDPTKAEIKVNYIPDELPVRKFKDGLPVEAAYQLADGQRFNDIREFKKLLLRNELRLAESIVEKLILFSTGAPVGFADRRDVQSLIASTAKSEHGFRDLIHAVIQSPIFRQP